MQIIDVKLDDLNVAENNSRTHSTQQIGQIVASIREFGFTNPLLVDEAYGIVAGHGRLFAARELGLKTVPCVVLAGLSETQKRAYLIADNQLPLNAGWNLGALKFEIEALQEADFELDVLGFDDNFLDDLLTVAPSESDDPIPPPPVDPVTREGDVWILGGHRVMCGDSTQIGQVETLCGSEKAQLIHADPPYGMGKQKDGVENDNLYNAKLDAFQMEWWATFRTFLVDNASAYIWGKAPDLWRLWYVGGLGGSEVLALRNEITWDKKNIAGMASDLLTQYPEASERCLFFQIGDQFLGNINQDQYWEGWEEIRGYLMQQAQLAALTATICKEITGVQMYAHWFSKSQWTLISEKYYAMLADALPGCFLKPYREIRASYDRLKGGYRNHVNGITGGMRAYFDNAHDVMRDVWEFSRVTGDERYGHATPKPVEMMDRVMKSSLPRGGLCLEPFCGTGPTVLAAERTGRRCYAMEITPAYVDATVLRWQAHTGLDAVLESTGTTFDEVLAAHA